MNYSHAYRRCVYGGLLCVVFATVIWLISETNFVQERGNLWRSTFSYKHQVLPADSDDDADTLQEGESTNFDVFDGANTLYDVNSYEANDVQLTDANLEFHDENLSCFWSPIEEHDCFPRLFQHLQVSLNASRTLFRRTHSLDQHPSRPSRFRYINRRWLFLGDSTMHMLFEMQISKHLTDDSIIQYQQQRQTLCFSDQSLQCHKVILDRCNTMSALSFENASSWKLPNFLNGEGPISHGLQNPSCTDCGGCSTEFLTCSMSDIGNDTLCSGDEGSSTQPTDDLSMIYTGPSYGGFLAIEFARDLELQTPQYKTTQENWLLNFISHNWNYPEAMEEFGLPICVMSAGLHDCAIPKITKAIYMRNVEWYLGLVTQQCDFIIWLANTSPLSSNFSQSLELIYEWNMAVQDLLLSSPILRQKSFFLDVFNSSIAHTHVDNVHMDYNWYWYLSNFFISVMNADFGFYEY